MKSPIVDRLIQQDVFFWDLSEERTVEISDNLKDLIGADSNLLREDNIARFISPEAVHDRLDLLTYDASTEWTAPVKTSDGKVFNLRFNCLSSYSDSDNIRHFAGVANFADARHKPINESQTVEILLKRMRFFHRFFSEIGQFSQLGICILGQDGYASTQWNDNLGLPLSAAHPVDLIDASSLDKADLDYINNNIELVRAHKLSGFHRSANVHKPQGTRVVDFTAFFSVESDSVTIVSLDVTDHKEYEKALEGALRKAEQMESLRSRFFNNVSHELRTPLNAIVGFSELIASSQTDPETSRFASIISNNNKTLLGLIDGILEMSQIQTGNRQVSRALEPLGPLMEQIYGRLQKTAPDGLEFKCLDRGSQSGVEVFVDRQAVERVLSALTDNAFKNTSKGSVVIWADVVDSVVRFHVEDTGCGIPTEQLDAIFEVFVKLNTFGHGSGLGLSICQGIARQMGGDIYVESTPGVGSHFWLELPATASPFELEDSLLNNKVLMLSSDADLSLSLSLMLSSCSISTTNREDFARMWLQTKPLLSVIDARDCPDVALHFVSNVRSRGDRYKVIVLLSADISIDEAELLKAGASEIVKTPISLLAFGEMVARYMQLPCRHIGTADAVIK